MVHLLYPLLRLLIIDKCFNHEPGFNGIFSRDNLPRIKDGAFVIILNDKQSKGTHWVSALIHRIRLCTLILLELNISLKV